MTGWKLDDTLENATNNDVQLDTPCLLYTSQTETQSGTAEAVMEEAAPESSAEAVPDASASDARAQGQARAAPVKEAVAGETLISDSM